MYQSLRTGHHKSVGNDDKMMIMIMIVVVYMICNIYYHYYPISSHWHCIESVRIQSYSSLRFPAFGLNTERYGVSKYSVRMRENEDRNNSKYGHSSRCVVSFYTP